MAPDAEGCGMSLTKSHLQDLDEAISRGTPESRERALWHATDLLIAGHYSEQEVLTFGKVICPFTVNLDVSIRRPFNLVLQ